MRLASGILAAAVIGVSIRAQTPASNAKPLAFEVASVKPSTDADRGVAGGCYGAPTPLFNTIGLTIPVGRCVVTAGRLSHLIAIAYDMQVQRIEGGPAWIWGAPRFNIAAKAENPATSYDDLNLMLQTLLADRFKLRIHREPRPLPGHAMFVGPKGPKFKESKAAEPSLVVHGAAINKLEAIDGKNKDLNSIIAKRVSMAQLAEALSRLPLNSHFVDMTGLTGLYDFSLSWEPDEDIARVVQDQLGLRLERQQVPVDFIIIDSAERPTEN